MSLFFCTDTWLLVGFGSYLPGKTNLFDRVMGEAECFLLTYTLGRGSLFVVFLSKAQVAKREVLTRRQRVKIIEYT